MKSLLEQYVKLALEAMTREVSGGTDSTEQDDEINEFSGAGAAGGFAPPLGASSDDLQPPTEKKRRKKQ